MKCSLSYLSSLPNVNLWVCWANLTRLIATGSLAKAYLRHGGHGQQLRYAIGSNHRNAPSYPNLFTVTVKWDHFRMAFHSNHSYLIPNTGFYWDIMFPLSQNISYTIYHIPYTIYHISYIIYPISNIQYPSASMDAMDVMDIIDVHGQKSTNAINQNNQNPKNHTLAALPFRPPASYRPKRASELAAGFHGVS